MHFQAAELAPDGATLRYRFRQYAKDGSIERLANCVIPGSERAVEAMKRRFGVRSAERFQRGDEPNEGDGTIGVQTTSCGGFYHEGYWTWSCSTSHDYPSRDGGDRGAPPGTCDPNTAVESCDSGGGDWTGGGSDPCAECGPDVPPPPPGDPNDAFDEPIAPNCMFPKDGYEKLWCTSPKPNADQAARITEALNKMEQLGGECVALAQHGRAILNNMRIFDQASNPGTGGGALRGGDWMVIGNYWVDYYFGSTVTGADDPGGPRNLQHMLAHELDHSKNKADHYGNIYNTPNSRACSGIS